MKRIVCMIAAGLLAGAAAQAELVGHWRMGEDATWDGSAWTVPDQTTSPANGTSVNMAEADRVAGAPLVFEVPSQGMEFNNAGYVDLGVPDKLNINNASLTVTAWVKPQSGSTTFRPGLRQEE